jgi:hypothetical protein
MLHNMLVLLLTRCVTKAQMTEQITAFQAKAAAAAPAAGAPAEAKPVVAEPAAAKKKKGGLNLVIAKDDKDLCKEMFGDLYSDELFATMADESGCISQERMMNELARLKASVTGGGEEAISATAAAALFTSKLETGIAVSCELKQLKGLFGRMIDSAAPADLENLRGASNTQFPFVIDYKGLHALLACSDGWAMLLKLGQTEADVKLKLQDADRQFKLVIFPGDSACPPPALATWDSLVAAALSEGQAGAAKLQAHLPALKSTPYAEIDPTGAIEAAHQGEGTGLSKEQYEPCEDTLLNARLFLRTQFLVSNAFNGSGVLPDGTEEYIVGDAAIAAIKGAAIVDIAVVAPPAPA